MQILINTRKKFDIKKDNKIFKSNYRFRLQYLIKTVILEKRLVHNSSIINRTITHNIIDLKLCYDRKLLNIGSIFKEVVEKDRVVLKLVAKVLPVLEY